MILINKMKDFKIYRVPTFLPTRIDNKKKFSALLMLTPNYESSKKLMNHPLFINKKRYESYYLQRDVAYYIDSKKIKYVEDESESVEESTYIEEMSAAERNALPDSAFGVPSKRKFPLDTEAHVRSAIKFFNYVDKEDEATLAKNIIKAMKKFNITDVKVSDKNRFSKYYKSNNESAEVNPFNLICKKCNSKDLILQGKSFICKNCGSIVSELRESEELDVESSSILKETDDILNTGDKLIFFNEDAKYDGILKRLLFQGRLKQRKDLLVVLDKVKADNPFIKYAFPEISKYKSRNIFVDLSYYMGLFLNNNNWFNIKGMNLFYDFMDRLLNKFDLKSHGYTDKKIFIPVLDWDKNHDGSVWNFRVSLNPISIIYQNMFMGNIRNIKKIFGDTEVIFTGNDKYFKVNFANIPDKDIKKYALKFRTFIYKICKGEEFEIEDIDTSAEMKDSSEVIAAKIVDKIEDAKGVDLTKRVAVAAKVEDIQGKAVNKELKTKSVPAANKIAKDTAQKVNNLENPANLNDNKAVVSKNTTNQSLKNVDDVDTAKADAEIMKLAAFINKTAAKASSEEDAMEDISNNDDIKSILMDLESDGEDDVKISEDRKSRMDQLSKDLMTKQVSGKTVEEILNKQEEEIPEVTLNVSGPNAEEWSNMKFMNFDKNYNIEKDIINAFRHFENTSRPLVIRDIKVEDNSTSEDRVMLYTVEYEDYRGKRYTVKLDIPIMKDNRFLLRGNDKSLQIQFFNMPVLKTENNQCQIVTNYNKIIISRYGDINGKATSLNAKFVKAAKKYVGNKIKFIVGNNKKISDKYNLPIDYIDLSSLYSKITVVDTEYYLNQDDIREKYKDIIDYKLGIPVGYNNKTKNIIYLTDISESFTARVISNIYYENITEFVNLLESMSSLTACCYSRCSLMDSKIPLVLVAAFSEGLRKTLDKAGIAYEIKDKLTKEEKYSLEYDYIKFSDGYIYFENTIDASLLLNGLKDCPTDTVSVTEIDNKNTYLSFLDGFCDRYKADGLENFYDLLIDPITKEVIEHYNLPSDYVSMLVYANALLANNKYIRHNDTSSRRMRRYEIVAGYTYKVLADAYGKYANELKHRGQTVFKVRQDAVIVALLTDPTSADDSCINALRDLEATNSISTKGLSGMNSDRAYSLDKRTYNDSMLNILGMSTGFASKVGVNRQTTLNSSITGSRGYTDGIQGNTDLMNDANSLTATEALTPFGCNRDDPMRTAMTFVQTSKHEVRTIDSDPLLVTSGADEAMAYMSSDRFCFKAKKDGIIKEVTDEYMILEYNDKTTEYVKLTNDIVKNSDGGYWVPLKLDKAKNFTAGQKIKANDILAYDKYSFSNSVGESDNLAYNIGKLAKVAIVNTDEGFEDSGVITEKMAKKLSTPINYQFSVFINKDSIVSKFLNVGQHVEVGDSLMVWMPPFDDEGADLVLKNLDMDQISELGKRTLNTEVTGTITKVAIYRTVEIEELSDSLKSIVSNYEKPYVQMEKKFKENGLNTSEIPAHYKLPTVGKLKGKEDGVLIEFYVEYLDSVGVGDKVVYFSANKAVEKNIIPEGLEPYTAFRPKESIDAFISETSIDKRMVTSTLIYGSLQKLMIELDRSVKDIMGISYDESTV